MTTRFRTLLGLMMVSPVAAALLLSVGGCSSSAEDTGQAERCNGLDDDGDGQIDEDLGGYFPSIWRDEDSDGLGAGEPLLDRTCLPTGYVEQGGDCEPLDAAVNPGVVETANGVDDNCNGLIDDVPPVYYLDIDLDGWGLDEVQYSGSLQHCEDYIRPRWTFRGGDCDDLDPYTHPDAAEPCDGVDRDCDGIRWEGPAQTWYVDADGDGMGTGDPFVQCEPPLPGASIIAGDCDDSDPSVPDATGRWIPESPPQPVPAGTPQEYQPYREECADITVRVPMISQEGLRGSLWSGMMSRTGRYSKTQDGSWVESISYYDNGSERIRVYYSGYGGVGHDCEFYDLDTTTRWSRSHLLTSDQWRESCWYRDPVPGTEMQYILRERLMEHSARGTLGEGGTSWHIDSDCAGSDCPFTDETLTWGCE